MAHVFISYAREDQDFAEVVQAKLEKAGHTVALDLDLLSAGDDWGDKLDAAIRDAHALVLVLSAESRKSEYVTFEWSFALGAGVRVIPIEYGGTELHPRLRVLQKLDFTNKARPWDKLLVEVAKAAEARAVAPAGDGPVAQAIRALGSLEAEERLAGIDALAQADGEEARKALAGALAHPLADVRIAAAKAFPDRKDPRIIRGLVDDLVRDRNPDKLDAFADALGEIGAAGVPTILALLAERTDLRDVERARLVWALGESRDPRAAEPLLAALKDLAVDVRSEAVIGLGKLGGENAAKALRAALQDPETSVREAAAEGLGRLGGESALKGLRAALLDDEGDVRGKAVAALGQLRDRGSVAAISQILATGRSEERFEAARALGRIGDLFAIPFLSNALRDGVMGVRSAATASLARLGDPTGTEIAKKERGAATGTLSPEDDELMLALIAGGLATSLPWIEERLTKFRSGVPPAETVKALASQVSGGEDTLIRVLSARPKHSNFLSERIAEALLQSGSANARQAVEEWRRSQP